MTMDEGKIVLDRKAFGALAVDSRVKILKALSERRKMLTELSAELKLSASSTKEHLDTLVEAGLIEKFDEGHKWKYYSLTKKGSGIITPGREIRVWVVLGLSIIGMLASSLLMFNAFPAPAAGAGEVVQATALAAPAPSAMNSDISALARQGAVPAAAEAPRADSGAQPQSLYLALGALCALAAAVCVANLAISRMR
jgi:DNA-binding transcriptional ArsR family regulator